MTLGSKEREAHRAANQQSVGELQETIDYRDLVRDLGTAEHRDQRASGILEHLR